jgi:hypothetical protein
VPRTFLAKLRLAALSLLNTRICHRECRALPAGRTPSYIVVTPHLIHLAPLASRNCSSGLQPVFVANGIDAEDLKWLRTLCPEVPVILLLTTLRHNSHSLIEHGVVINYLAEASQRDFCIQDADCFVSDRAFWDCVTIDPATEYASGPFFAKGEEDHVGFPQTFLLCLNRMLMHEYRHAYRITAETVAEPPARARHLLRAAGYHEGKYLEAFKGYHDTLQLFWIAAQHHGFYFRLLPGERQIVHHIGGTSYLYRTFDDLAHWDYWPLNVHYFNLRIMEFPGCARFRDRFQRLIDHHRTADRLLAAFPDFAKGWRRRESDLIIDRMNAATLYRQ